jgi:hypothetical protein
MSSDALAFCENVGHIDAARATGKAEILALTPAAAWACQQRGLCYYKLEDFYSPTELVAQYSSIFGIELQWLNWLDGRLQEVIPHFAVAGFRAASAYQGLLMTLLDEFYVGQFILRRVLAHTKPSEILYCSDVPMMPPAHLQHLRSVIPALLPQLSAEAGSSLRELAEPDLPNPIGGIPRRLPGVIGPAIKNELRLLRYAGLRAYLRSCMIAPSSAAPVLFVGHGYDLDPLALALRRKRCRVEWLDNDLPSCVCADAPLVAELTARWPEACAMHGLWAPFAEWGLKPPGRAQSALQHWWQHVVPHLWAGYQRATARLRRKRYVAVVSWEAGTGTLSAPMLQAAQARQVPRIIYQHGSTGRLRICDPLWHSWLSNSDIFLCYGSATQAHIDQARSINHMLARPHAVGSARLESVLQRLKMERIRATRAKLMNKDPRPIVLYVPIIFGGYGRDVSGELSGYPNVSYLELQQRVLRQFAEFPGVHLVYKDLVAAAGWHNPIPDFIRQQIPNGTTILNPRLTDLVWAVDAIIVDHIITALGEAALTRKRLIVYDGGSPSSDREPPTARAALERRARVASTPEEFVAFTRAFLEANDFSELPEPDDTFLRACVTHQNDGGAVERAADLILSMR